MEMDIIKHIKDLMEERGWTNLIILMLGSHQFKA